MLSVFNQQKALVGGHLGDCENFVEGPFKALLCSVHLPDRRGGVRGLCRHLPPRGLLPLHAGHDALPEVGSGR